jgi:hypothetical protein
MLNVFVNYQRLGRLWNRGKAGGVMLAHVVAKTRLETY